MSEKREIRRLMHGVDRSKGPWRKPTRCAKVFGAPKRTNAKQTAPEDTEDAVKREIMELARAKRIPLWRQQAGMVWAGASPVQLAPKGAADLTGIIPWGPWFGRRLEVECKRRYGGTQSPEQIKWQQEIEKYGGVYLLVRSASEFWESLQPYLADAQ